ncbi:unnamed protein product [Gongylonema pulchrum]|uniref:Transposase n=1 Tax=Gongylonema pulchrum TaxID=637853 RepID=A0A183ER50_9BILA|nr:unnamed protein product [Gongylonema pulchrum]
MKLRGCGKLKIQKNSEASCCSIDRTTEEGTVIMKEQLLDIVSSNKRLRFYYYRDPTFAIWPGCYNWEEKKNGTRNRNIQPKAINAFAFFGSKTLTSLVRFRISCGTVVSIKLGKLKFPKDWKLSLTDGETHDVEADNEIFD